jgi:prolyl-tRNA synthetase
MIGGTGSHEFILPSEIGEATIIRCSACAYAANQEVAAARKPTFSREGEATIPPLETVHTPQIKTIEDLAGFFHLPPEAFLKTVVYRADGRLVVAVVPGGSAVNEVKLANVVHAASLRLATDEELQEAGIIPGFVSPVGLQGVEVVVDAGVGTAKLRRRRKSKGLPLSQRPLGPRLLGRT